MKFNPIPYIYYTLAGLLPIVFFGSTSEIFEINKIVFVYLAAILVAGYWTISSILKKRIIFTHSPLNIPILIFLASQVIATGASVDQRVSLLGYYGRWNGGLMSQISYSILYFGFINFMDKKHTVNTIKFILLGGIFVAVEGVLEHFGISTICLVLRGNITTSCWAEEVKIRVFSTLGQPNWLAAYLAGLAPLAWLMAISSKQKAKSWFWGAISILFFATLLFTKSRSGLLGFVAASIIFWLPILWFNFKQKNRHALRIFIFLSTIYLLLATILIFVPYHFERLNNQVGSTNTEGTPSSQIRSIIWEGAIKTWQAHPLFGTGTETFAFSFPAVRSPEHNLTSEWNYVYNKAHNEYLNYLATTGAIGLLAYLLVIISAIYQITRDLRFRIQDLRVNVHKSYILIHISLLASFMSILVTNFFGFSVTATSFLFFIFPAIAFAISNKQPTGKDKPIKLSVPQKLLTLSCLFTTLYLLLALAVYWHADLLFAKGQKELEQGNYSEALTALTEALAMPENIYKLEFAKAVGNLAIIAYEDHNTDLSQRFAHQAVEQIESAENLSPWNAAIRKSAYQIYTDLSELDSKYLLLAHQELTNAIPLAPTDPTLYLSLGATNLRLGQTEDAISAYKKAVELKDNYESARLALARVYLNQGETYLAKEQIDYVLKHINAKNEEALKIEQNIEKSHK